MLHAIKYKAMIGNKKVVNDTKIFYNEEEAKLFVNKIYKSFKDDLVFLDFYGPNGIISRYDKHNGNFKHD